MPTLREEGIVLRLAEFSETSQIATVFTRGAGQLRLIAKGVRRSTKARFAAGLDLLERGEFWYAPARGEAQLQTLTDWRQTASYSGLRRRLTPLYAALYAADAVRLLTVDQDPHPPLFDALAAALERFEGAGSDEVAAILAEFQWRLLDEIGFRPNLRGCVACGRARDAGRSAYFSPRAGGLVCRACADEYRDRRVLSAKFLDAGRAGAAPVEWFDFLDQRISYVAERALEIAPWLLRRLVRPRVSENTEISPRGK